MIDHLRNQTGYIVNTTTDKHGDQKQSSLTAVQIRFRYQTSISTQPNREAIESDAIIWLAKDASVEEGTIIKYEDDYWRVKTLVKAMRNDGVTQFLKAYVDKHTM